MSAEFAVSVLLERRWCLGLIRIRTSPAIRALGGQQFLSKLDTDGIDETFGDVGGYGWPQQDSVFIIMAKN